MILTPNYSLQTYQSDDIVNVMTVDKANMEAIDMAMHNNQVATIGTAVELTTGNVHALTRSNTNTAVFRFTATSNYTAGDTFVVDTTPVLALLPSGGTLPTGAYIVGSEVLCALRDNLLTVYVSPGAATIAEDSEMLGGQLPEYYATATAAQNAMTTATAAGELAQQLATNMNNLMTPVVRYTNVSDIFTNTDKVQQTNNSTNWIDIRKYSNGIVYAQFTVRTQGSPAYNTILGRLPENIRPATFHVYINGATILTNESISNYLLVLENGDLLLGKQPSSGGIFVAQAVWFATNPE